MVVLLSCFSYTFCHRSVIQTRCSCPRPFSQTQLSALGSFHSQNKAVRRKTHSSITALPFDLSPPPIDHDLYDDMAVAGAKVSEDWVIETFHNDEEALDAVDIGTVVVDLSGYGRIRVSGEDRIQFLHNQSTANFEALSEGGKTAVTLVVSPSTSGSISEMLKKYIFFSDKVEIQDISDKTCLFALVGPKSNQVMVDLNLGDLIGQPLALQSHMQVGGNSVTVAVGSVISEQGFSLLMSPAAAGVIWKTLLSHGTTPMGSNALETYRILQGCYKGQETIARLITYDGIKQKLWGIQLSSPVEPGSPITVEGKKAGKLTSYTAGKKENEHFGLGYIKKKAASKGDTVMIGDDISGIVVDVPYLARQRPLVLNSNP